MDKTPLKTYQDCEDLLEGALWMGTGGGGCYADGMKLLLGALENGLSLEWIDVDSLPDDVWTATVGLHGSIAPISKDTQAQIKKIGLVDNLGDMFISKAVGELGRFLGMEIGCLVPAELGPEAIPEALVSAARLGIPVVDGDYVGRAVPEEMQATYCLFGKQSNLFTSVDKWGNVAIVKSTVNTHMLERFAKALAVAAFGYTAVATTPLKANELKKILVRGTLTRCLKIGQTLRLARNADENPIDAVLKVNGGWRLFEGRIIGLESDDREGYLFGTLHILGTGKFRGQTLDIWFKNENLVSWLNEQPWVSSPDLITLVYKETGAGVNNASVKVGDEVEAVGMKGFDGFRTALGLSLSGPRHFGFDIEYTPIEELLLDQ